MVYLLICILIGVSTLSITLGIYRDNIINIACGIMFAGSAVLGIVLAIEERRLKNRQPTLKEINKKTSNM